MRKEHLKEQAEDANKHTPLPPPQQLSPQDAGRETYEEIDGVRWLLCATDGAVSNQQRKVLSRAGFAAFYGDFHTHNASVPLHGPAQGSYDAETEAIKLITHIKAKRVEKTASGRGLRFTSDYDAL